jgi:hypothetical protein
LFLNSAAKPRVLSLLLLLVALLLPLLSLLLLLVVGEAETQEPYKSVASSTTHHWSLSTIACSPLLLPLVHA